jgi:hypothetical protein
VSRVLVDRIADRLQTQSHMYAANCILTVRMERIGEMHALRYCMKLGFEHSLLFEGAGLHAAEVALSRGVGGLVQS